jgi:GH43 family beta-xylosidase
VLASVAAAQAPYTNPVIGDAHHVEREVPDPFVLKWNGEYFLYNSGDPITAWHSSDLVHWDLIGPVLASSKDPNAWNQADVWAPEVVYRDGKFYLYYTATRKSEDWRVGERERRVGVAVSDSPRGPFMDSGNPVTQNWAIDGDVLRDPDTGDEWLFYSYLDEQNLHGAGIAAQRLASWNTVSGEPILITRGDHPWEDKDGDPHNGSLRYTNEAPTALKHHGRFYMIYSGGSWDLPTYALSYAFSDVPPRGDLSAPAWKKHVPPILRSTPLVDAPGHNSVVKAPNNVDDINVYHARTVPFVNPWDRLPYVDRLFWHHDGIFTPPPSTGDLTPPDRPVWESTSGSTALPAQFSHYTQFLHEVNVRVTKTSSGCGETVFRSDTTNRVFVAIETGQIALRGMVDSKPVAPVTHALPHDFVPTALHQLLTTRDGDEISVMLDGVNVLRATMPLGGRSGGISSYSGGAGCDFGYSALTPYYDETFLSASALNSWKQVGGTWQIDNGSLRQTGSGNELAYVLKGEPASAYEFSASVRWGEQSTENAMAGVVAAAASSDVITAGFEHNIWPFAKFWVAHLKDGRVQETRSAPLPRGFLYDDSHTIRLVRDGSAFIFFLDGQEMIDARFNLGDSQVGLFTSGVRASFADALWRVSAVRRNLLLDGGFESTQWNDQGAPSIDSAWKVSGAARVTTCCAHSGQRRLLISDGEGAVRQTAEGLTPGHYTLHAWVMTAGNVAAAVVVNGSQSVTVPPSGGWSEVSTEFTVPAGKNSATVEFRAKSVAGVHAFAAADDFYLFSTPR